MIRRLLIANRGEIAVRVIRAAREMGIWTIAVASDADATARHAVLADQVVRLSGSAARETYLDIDRVVAACVESGADAVHPGYGFLSERPEFAEACRAAGILFIGPSPEAMRRLGSKIEAKQLAVECQVPIVPGFFHPGASDDDLRRASASVGYPLMLKASAGGGGRGMRIVRSPDQFDDELRTARAEAMQSFGDDAMMIERLIDRPRHIEVQALADHHGNVDILFERECSIQRRHQKLIEEAPMAGPFGEVWPAMRDAAKRLLSAAGYVGAGTVEFMLDGRSSEFFFLEVNARLQVEHPVTEAITGVDLVQAQIRIAHGEPLAAVNDRNRDEIRGHSIEVRIIAENPGNGFVPSQGQILAWAEPRMPGIRVDAGFGVGDTISPYYDSLLAKVIAHGESRDQARLRLIRALEDFHILGVQTNIAFLLDVLHHPGFSEGAIDTGFLGREFADWSPDAPFAELSALLGRGAVSRVEEKAAITGPWASREGFRITVR